MARTRWQIMEETQPVCVEDVTAVLLKNRGVESPFLSATLKDLEPCLAMRGMDQGAELMARHLLAGSKLILVGDYDCDGVTSVAQMDLFLKDIGYENFVVIIPQRAEGYGVPERAVADHPDARLLISMDCGTTDRRAISMARDHGMDCIVIDHHEVPQNGTASANVVINPKHPDCDSIFKEYCAAGLTLLFLARLRRSIQGEFPQASLGGKYLALAAIGTVTDMAPLVHGNRIMVKHGLCSINNGAIATVNHLIKAAGLSGKPITAGHIAYYLGPRINAAGRMADPLTALELLVSDQPERLEWLAGELNRLNAKRQYEEDSILREVRKRYTSEESRNRTLVMADSKWSSGIVGIVASRVLQEIHYGPTIIFSIDDANGVARGSARSVPGFALHEALKACEEFLLKWGGHKMAAGMTVSLDHLEAFTKRFEETAAGYPSEVYIPKGKVDMELDLRLISRDLCESLQQLEPFGLGNPTPTFAARRTRVSIARTFGKEGSHLRLILNNNTEAVFWRGSSCYQSGRWKDGDILDVVFQVVWDDYRGKAAPIVKDIGNLF